MSRIYLLLTPGAIESCIDADVGPHCPALDVLLTIPLPTPSPNSPSPLLPKSAFPPPPQPLINLADFGLAKRLPPPPAPATLTTRCGSDSFACPEIIMGKEYDGRKADSWACGVVLFAMLVSPIASFSFARFSLGRIGPRDLASTGRHDTDDAFLLHSDLRHDHSLSAPRLPMIPPSNRLPFAARACSA